METKSISEKAIQWLVVLLSLAAILSALLIGGMADRLIVGLPAWKHLDISVWATYSRHADLGNGLIVYPVEAIGSFLLLLAVSVILWRNKNSGITETILTPVYLATAFSLAGLILTFFAAPFMLSIKSMNDPAALQNAFDRFYYWSTFREIAQVLSFIACIWAMAKAIRKTALQSKL